MEDYTNTALSLGSTKEAALYFDHVVPVSIAFEFLGKDLDDLRDEEIQDDAHAMAALAPEGLRTNSDYNGRMRSLQLLWTEFFLALLDHPETSQMTIAGAQTTFSTTLKDLKAALTELTERFGLANAPVVCPAAMLSGPSTTEYPESVEDVALTLSRLRMIDISKASWKQVVELRKDANARQKLRRLRLFAADNYSGKNLAYIEDDLSRRIYDYEEEARRWGFETTYAGNNSSQFQVTGWRVGWLARVDSPWFAHSSTHSSIRWDVRRSWTYCDRGLSQKVHAKECPSGQSDFIHS